MVEVEVRPEEVKKLHALLVELLTLHKVSDRTAYVVLTMLVEVARDQVIASFPTYDQGEDFAELLTEFALGLREANKDLPTQRD